MITTTADGHDLEVLRPNGQPATTARLEILQGYLPRPEWCVVTNTRGSI